MGFSLKLLRSRRHGYEDIAAQCIQTINVDEECTIICTGYLRNWLHKLFCYSFCIVFLGVPCLFLRWYPVFEAYLFWQQCTLETAKIILIKDRTGESSLHPVCESSDQYGQTVRYFVYKLQRFVWCGEQAQFKRTEGLADGVNTFSQILLLRNGQTQEEKQRRLNMHGKNMISVNVKSYWQLLVDEILNPFYIFEFLSIILWIFDEYTYYAVFIIIVSVISLHFSLRQTKKQCMKLHDMASSFTKSRVVIHTSDYGSYEESSEELVPGDVLEIPLNGCVMMCDALLLSGTCIVNESSLTGESLPVTKVPPVHADEVYKPNSLHMKHTLYCGTQILQTRYYEDNKVLAIVTETGSNTAKGKLIRSILYPKSMAFDFLIESIKYVILLFVVASLAMAYSTYLYFLREASLETLLLRTLDLITIVVPPTLPAAMTAGTYYSQKRLKRKGIFCISPTRILVSGKATLVCFDKTGTLTEEGMDVWGVLPVAYHPCTTTLPAPLADADIVNDIGTISDKSLIKSALASCHSLTVIDNEICGEPLDVTMFKATGWELEEPGEDNAKFDKLDPTVVRPKQRNIAKDSDDDFLETCLDFEIPYEIGLIRQFPFTSSAQNMTVICRVLGARNMIVFSKGAPEKIMRLCHPNTSKLTF